MGLKCLPGLKQRLQAGKNTWPSIGAGSVSGVILGPLVMRHRYFGGFGLGHSSIVARDALSFWLIAKVY